MLPKLKHILSLVAFAAVDYNVEPKWKSFASFIDVWYSQIWKMAKRDGSRNNININSGFISLANVRLHCVQAFDCYTQTESCICNHPGPANWMFIPEMNHFHQSGSAIEEDESWKFPGLSVIPLPLPMTSPQKDDRQCQPLSLFTLLMLERGGWRRDSSTTKLGFLLFFHDQVFSELQSSPTITSYMHELRNFWEFYFPF